MRMVERLHVHAGGHPGRNAAPQKGDPQDRGRRLQVCTSPSPHAGWPTGSLLKKIGGWSLFMKISGNSMVFSLTTSILRISQTMVAVFPWTDSYAETSVTASFNLT